MTESTPTQEPITSIDVDELDHVRGGAARITARVSANNDQLVAMLTQISSSIKQLAQANSNNSSNPMQSMLPMLMMGGLGGR